jgi:hypothetical protein
MHPLWGLAVAGAHLDHAREGQRLRGDVAERRSELIAAPVSGFF